VPRIITAVCIAIVLSLATLYFGFSFLSRWAEVAQQRRILTSQLNDLVSNVDRAVPEALRNQLQGIREQLTAENLKRHSLALAAQQTSDLMKQVNAKLDAANGPVADLQDEFEDEFGRRIRILGENPRQYDAGPRPTYNSDPLRYDTRIWLWGKAAGAVTAYNTVSNRWHPRLEEHQETLAKQMQLKEEAEKKWQALTAQQKEVEARIQAFLDASRDHLPSAETIRMKLENCALVAAIFALSDGLAFVTAFSLTVMVWVRSWLIAGWFRPTRILTDCRGLS
jgi:hypothetical protein